MFFTPRRIISIAAPPTRNNQSGCAIFLNRATSKCGNFYHQSRKCARTDQKKFVLALVELHLVPPLIITLLYAFLSIRLEGASILDFLRCAACFLFLKQQYFEWRQP